MSENKLESKDFVPHKNTITKSKIFGPIELKFISVGDLENIDKLSKKTKNDKEFVTKVLHHQLIGPLMTLSVFKGNLTDSELLTIARDFIKTEQYTFKYFKETNDAEFFNNFRKAINTYIKKREEEFRPIAGSFIQTQNFLTEFNKKYENIIRPHIEAKSYATEKLSEIGRLYSKYISESLINAQSIRPILESYEYNARFLSELVKPQIKYWIAWAEKNQAIFQYYNKYWLSFTKKYEITKKEAIPILKKYKWFVSPSLPIDFVNKAVKIGKKSGNQSGAMNKLFVDYFSISNYSNLEALISNWESNKIFKPRMKIFRDCVNTLKTANRRSNPSNVILPTLIAQIDGIQKEFMKIKGLSLVWEGKRKKWKNSTGKTIDWKEWFKKHTSEQELLDLANDVFLNVLFQKALPDEPLETPFNFNRHKILHGESLKYGRIDNTIRAFLILDFLAYLK